MKFQRQNRSRRFTPGPLARKTRPQSRRSPRLHAVSQSITIGAFVLCLCNVRNVLELNRKLATRRQTTIETSDTKEFDNETTFIRGSLVTMGVDKVWKQLLDEQEEQQLETGNTRKERVVIEVGMHKAKQCIEAAERGYEAHCMEPSPRSYDRVVNRVHELEKTLQERIHLYKAAAGQRSDEKVKFTSTGGPGDHVGVADMWNMKLSSYEDEAAPDDGMVAEVSTIRLDDIILGGLEDSEKQVYLLKIDTQGYEPQVIAGLETSLRQHKIDLLILKFWPTGMDLLTSRPPGTSCGLLNQLQVYGYVLYALHPESHPKAPRNAMNQLKREMPLSTPLAYCHHFYEIEASFPDPNYKMGYWSHILAVRPTLMVESPSTHAMTAIMDDLRSQMAF